MPPIPTSLLLPLSLPHSPADYTQNAINTTIPQPTNNNILILQPRRGGGAKGGGGGGSSISSGSGGGKSKGGATSGGSKITTTQIIIISVCCSLAVALFYLVLHLWAKKPWRLLSKKRVEQARQQQEVLDAAFAKKPVPTYAVTSTPVPLPGAVPAPTYTPTPTATPAPATYTNGNLDGIFTGPLSTAPTPTPTDWGNEPGNGVIAAPAPGYVGYTPATHAPIVIQEPTREHRKEPWAERWLPGWK